MQLNNPKNNTSNLIKQSESAKKKARRRLIGSIFMLFTALIILLNVTTKVKPIPVTPKVIEIGGKAVPTTTQASAPTTKPLPVASSAPINASSPVAANNNTSNESESNGFKGGVLNRAGDANQATPDAPSIIPNPIIITMNIGHKPTPEEILNGNTNNTSETIYYIQIAAGQNKHGLQTIQKNLDSKGIKSFVQNAKSNTYRLRAGPYRNKNDANDQLSLIKKSLTQ